jgi:methionyl-tRNA formyltransferase
MRVVFLGTPATALPALEAIESAGHELPLIVTQPDRPLGRSSRPQPPPVKLWALAHGVPVLQPEKPGAEAASSIAAARPDVLAVVAYGRILPRSILALAPHGAVNLHFSLLPAYRGAAPVQWALARGETETGVSTFRIDEGLDTGDVYGQRRVPIEAGEHAPALLTRLAVEGAGLLASTLAGMLSATIRAVPQDAARATAAPRLAREDGHWSSAWSASELEGRVRGFDPWPGVWAMHAAKRLRIVEARACADRRSPAAAGTVLGPESDTATVACAGGTVAALDVVQAEGGRPMRGREAINGRLLVPGERLEPPRPSA